MIRLNIIWLTIVSIFSAALIIGGFFFISFESSTSNKIEMFGNSASSSNIGLILIFIGIGLVTYFSYIFLKVRQIDVSLSPKGAAGGNAKVIGGGEAIGGKGGNTGSSFGPGGKGGSASVIGNGKAKGGAGGDAM